MELEKIAGANVDPITSIIVAANNLATNVGPEWGLAFVVAILLLFPKWGVVVHLASLFQEDRIDARKRKMESERLAKAFRERPDKQLRLPSKSEQKSLPPSPKRSRSKSKKGEI